MGLTLFLNGLWLGFIASIPVGPIGVLIIQKTINKGRIHGLASGFGAASADTLYAVVAGLGISFVTNFLEDQQLYLRLFGGLLLLYFGLKMFFTDTIKQARSRRNKESRNILGDIISVFFLTISNPIAIVVFGALFASLGFVAGEITSVNIFYLTLGVLLGAFLWWSTLTTIVNTFRKKFRLRNLWWLNKISGVAIIGLAFFALLSIFLLF